MYTKLWMSLRIDVCIRTCSRNSRIVSPLRTLFDFQRRQKMPTFFAQPIELLSFSRFCARLARGLRGSRGIVLPGEVAGVARPHEVVEPRVACAATTTISAHRRRRSISSRSSWDARAGQVLHDGVRAAPARLLRSSPLAPLLPWR